MADTVALYPLPCGCWQLRLPDGREIVAHDLYAEQKQHLVSWGQRITEGLVTAGSFGKHNAE